MNPSVPFWAVTAFLFGITIGSFLNAVIYRLPRRLTLLKPRHSICPKCEKTLSAIDLVPLLSFLLLGAKCRQCKAPIAWRYFWVELITGALFVALVLRYPPPQYAPDCIALICFTAVLVPVFCIDLESFSIPTSLNLLALLIPLARDAWGVLHHEPGHALLWGWLPPSVLGAAVGALIFGVIRFVGWLWLVAKSGWQWKYFEAMGLGDPLLARGMGAMLVSLVPHVTTGHVNPFYFLRLFPIWVVLSTFSGVVVGPALIWMRLRNEKLEEEKRRQEQKSKAKTPEPIVEEPPLDDWTMAQALNEVAFCLYLGDLREYLEGIFRSRSADTLTSSEGGSVFEDDWKPAPTAIPFGPFLVIGFLATVFVGEWLTAAYLAYALPQKAALISLLYKLW